MTTVAEFDAKYNIKDAPTPPNTLMSGTYKQSFAYFTLRERLPVILTGIIDNLTQEKDELAAKYGEEAREEIKTIAGHLSKLKYQLQTDKPLEQLEDNEADVKRWNRFISELPADENSFFKTCWLYAECYMYRRISSFFKVSTLLQQHDYFAKQKRKAAVISEATMAGVVQSTRNLPKDGSNFIKLLKLNLWGNKCDLSMSKGAEVKPCSDPLGALNSLDEYVLVDNAIDIWNCISIADTVAIVDIVCDNAGYELFTDFILAEYIIDQKLAKQVRFHVKAIPWFISDVMASDFHWFLEFLREHEKAEFKELGVKWTQYLAEDKFHLMPTDYFWTSPYEFYRMKKVNHDLYQSLKIPHLLIFKGDLNYRKLIGDYSWTPTESFEHCLRGFQPTNLCTLRTVKADLICGLAPGLAEELTIKNPDWMITGEYAVIQFATKTKEVCD